MNLIIFQDDDVQDNGSVVLNDHRAKHIVKVLRSERGERVRVGRLGGRIGYGEVIDIQKKFPFRVELHVELVAEPPAKNPVDLILALPRPIMLKRILGYLGQLGIANLYVIHADRVERSFWHANIFEEHEYLPFLIDGLEQAVDTVLPNVVFYRKFHEFMKFPMPSLVERYDNLFFAHPKGEGALHNLAAVKNGKTLIAIGPEGGWLEHEERQFMECGFTSFTLGERILKVDTAVVNIHGSVMAMLE